MRLAVLALVIAVPASARAEVPALRRATAPMQTSDDSVCSLLRADKHDVCKRIAKAAHAQVFQSGSRRGIRRVVLAIDRAGERLVSDGADFLGEDCTAGACVTLTSITPTIRDLAIGGRAGVLVELVASFRQQHATWTTESLIACGPNAADAWKCTTVELDRCAATIGDDGALTTSCGTHTTLSFD